MDVGHPRGKEFADSWTGLINSYYSYRKRPYWTGWGKRLPNRTGRLSKADEAFLKERGRSAAREARQAVRALRKVKLLPSVPSKLGQAQMERIVSAVRRKRIKPRVDLPTFWEAVILHRNRYTCAYCGRDAWKVYRDEKKARTLRMVVDHILARRLGGRSYSFGNSAATCWSCNLLKSGLPVEAFRRELLSMAQAVATDKLQRP